MRTAPITATTAKGQCDRNWLKLTAKTEAARFRTAMETVPSTCTAWRIVDREDKGNKPAFELPRFKMPDLQRKAYSRQKFLIEYEAVIPCSNGYRPAGQSTRK